MYDLLSDTNIYKNTYHELVCWIRELLTENYLNNHAIIRARGLEEKNYEQAAKIMELEWELRVMEKEYGSIHSNVVSNEELDLLRKKRKLKIGGGPPSEGDWLSGMAVGTEFLVSPKVSQDNWILTKFMHAGMKNGNVLIIPMQGESPVEDDRQWIWVRPDRFCKFWEFMGYILIPESTDEQSN